MVLYEIREFETIGDKYAKILEEKLNTKYVDELYKFSKEEITKITGIEEKRVEQFLSIIDLFKIPNISIRNAELLYHININSVEELSHRQAVRIYNKLKEIDEVSYLIILQFPSFSQISEWIYYAKLMSRRIKYGRNVPMILFPMINIHQASELKQYQIFTAIDFINARNYIKNLRRKLDLNKEEYQYLLELIDLIGIDGIDLILAEILHKATIKTQHAFISTPREIIEKNVKLVLEKYPEDQHEIYTQEINDVLYNLQSAKNINENKEKERANA
ncbi:MAG: DUF4332 domain-containing protein [Promethearchaeota archaeon]